MRAIDAALAIAIDAVRNRPDEVAAAVGRLSAEYGVDRINAVLDRVERRLRRQLPRAIRDAARGLYGHA